MKSTKILLVLVLLASSLSAYGWEGGISENTFHRDAAEAVQQRLVELTGLSENEFSIVIYPLRTDGLLDYQVYFPDYTPRDSYIIIASLFAVGEVSSAESWTANLLTIRFLPSGRFQFEIPVSDVQWIYENATDYTDREIVAELLARCSIWNGTYGNEYSDLSSLLPR